MSTFINFSVNKIDHPARLEDCKSLLDKSTYKNLDDGVGKKSLKKQINFIIIQTYWLYILIEYIQCFFWDVFTNAANNTKEQLNSML